MHAVVNNIMQKNNNYYKLQLFIMTFWSELGILGWFFNPEIQGLGTIDPRISGVKMRQGSLDCNPQSLNTLLKLFPVTPGFSNKQRFQRTTTYSHISSQNLTQGMTGLCKDPDALFHIYVPSTYLFVFWHLNHTVWVWSAVQNTLWDILVY